MNRDHFLSRVPYLRTIVESCNPPEGGTVCVMGGSQSGKTEVILSLICYCCVIDPAPSLLLTDNLISAKELSEDRLKPLFRDSPILTGLVSTTVGPASDWTRRRFGVCTSKT